MANDIGFKVEGLTKVVRDLQSLGLEVDDLKDAFSEIAREGAQVAAGFAPKRSGALAASVRGNRAKSKAVVSAGRARVPYAGAINYGWGTQSVGYKHGKYLGGMRGTFAGARFMQKTDAVMAPKALQELEHAINRKIQERGLA
jgi:hypothetical protein